MDANKNQKNYLLGYGERLVEKIERKGGGGSKKYPYSLERTKQRLKEQLLELADAMDALPAGACPMGYGVALFAIHPSFIAKSYHPQGLFNAVHILPLGSRQKEVTPEAWGTVKHPSSALTTEFFLASKRENFRRFVDNLDEWTEATDGQIDLRKMEKIQMPYDIARPLVSETDYPLLEVVMHVPLNGDFILEGFRSYLRSLDIKVDLDKRIPVGGLCFIPVKAPRSLVEKISEYSFLRVLREMPSLRFSDPVLRQVQTVRKVDYELPDEPSLDGQIKAAIFDGGLPKTHVLERWVKYRQIRGVGKSVESFEAHGLATTSALLFGSLSLDKQPDTPFCSVDHYRVLDEKCNKDSQSELYEVIKRIQNVLQNRKYDFVNLSIGPVVPVEDTEVHAWTAILDQLLADGNTLTTVAVGNTGEDDWESGNARIQPPSDCVNAMAIGAANSQGAGWKRADYSSIGFGRSPGLIKPDAVAFGGCEDEPFYSIKAGEKLKIIPVAGTSFAAPAALRMAIGLRTVLGNVLNPLTLKALLLHRCENVGQEIRETGRGRILSSIDELITCEDGSAHVVYQGELYPAQGCRAQIPVPAAAMTGKIKIRATFCFASEVDTEDSFNYTRSGLEIYFRPHQGKTRKDANEDSYAATTSFFDDSSYRNEIDSRKDYQKWETTLCGVKTKFCEKIKDPVFDIHYVARSNGGRAIRPQPIPYALVVSVEKPDRPELYNEIFNRYRNQLEMIQPQLQLPIKL